MAGLGKIQVTSLPLSFFFPLGNININILSGIQELLLAEAGCSEETLVIIKQFSPFLVYNVSLFREIFMKAFFFSFFLGNWAAVETCRCTTSCCWLLFFPAAWCVVVVGLAYLCVRQNLVVTVLCLSSVTLVLGALRFYPSQCRVTVLYCVCERQKHACLVWTCPCFVVLEFGFQMWCYAMNRDCNLLQGCRMF